MTGIVLCGAIGCFDEVNRLSVEVLGGITWICYRQSVALLDREQMMMGNWEKQLVEKKEIKEKDKIRREKLSIMLLVGCVLAYALAKITY